MTPLPPGHHLDSHQHESHHSVPYSHHHLPQDFHQDYPQPQQVVKTLPPMFYGLPKFQPNIYEHHNYIEPQLPHPVTAAPRMARTSPAPSYSVSSPQPYHYSLGPPSYHQDPLYTFHDNLSRLSPFHNDISVPLHRHQQHEEHEFSGHKFTPFVYHGPSTAAPYHGSASPSPYHGPSSPSPHYGPGYGPSSPAYLSVTTPAPRYGPSPASRSYQPASNIKKHHKEKFPLPFSHQSTVFNANYDQRPEQNDFSRTPRLFYQEDNDFQKISNPPFAGEASVVLSNSNNQRDNNYPNYQEVHQDLIVHNSILSSPDPPKLHLVPAKPAISFIDPPPSPSPSPSPRPTLTPRTRSDPLVLNPSLLFKTRSRQPSPAVTFPDDTDINSAVVKQRQSAVLQRRLNAGRQSKSLKTTAPNRNSLFSGGARSKEKFASASHVISRDHVKSDQKSDKQQIVHHQPAAAGHSGKSAALLKLMEIAGDDWSPRGSGAKETARSGARGRQEFSCPLSEGHFPEPGSCAVYYQCAQGTPHRRQCEAGLSWSVEADQCDWEANVKCDGGQRP